MSVNFDELRSQNPEWTNCLIFTGKESQTKVAYSSIDAPSEESLSTYIKLFNDYDSTIKSGLYFNEVHYHVHRFYDGVMYGRADPNTNRTDGFCLYRTDRDGKDPLYALITFDLPNVTARVVPLMAKAIEAIKAQIE